MGIGIKSFLLHNISRLPRRPHGQREPPGFPISVFLYQVLIPNRYDGKGIGAFSPDKIKSHNHAISWHYQDATGGNGIAGSNATGVTVHSVTGDQGDNESAPASISVYLCIKY
jgi:hypothetical protein